MVSGYFAWPKKTPGKWRPIVSLKYTNSYIAYQKFRMCTPAEVKRWVLPGYLMTSVDLTDAYFAIPLEEDAWRFTRFQWRGKTYEYKVIMFGLAPSARVFTKMLHPALLFLKDAFGIMLVAYLDDILIQAGDFDTCVRHAEITVLVLQALGYGVNFNKSSLTPSQSIEHLGLVWDSAGMTVSIPQDKVAKIQERARALSWILATLSWGMDTVMPAESQTRPRCSMDWEGVREDLLKFTPYPSACSTSTVISACRTHVSKSPAWISMSSKYATNMMPKASLRNSRAGWSILVKTLAEGARPNMITLYS